MKPIETMTRKPWNQTSHTYTVVEEQARIIVVASVSIHTIFPVPALETNSNITPAPTTTHPFATQQGRITIGHGHGHGHDRHVGMYFASC